MTSARHRRSRAVVADANDGSGGFRAIFAIREFRTLWLADLQSAMGDQLARVALSVLVYRDTGSGFLTAGVYALTFLPALIGSLAFGHLADRLPKRALLVGGDLLRAVLLAAMALPQLPLWSLTPLLVAAVVVGTPWQAAESALVSEILHGERYVMGTGLRAATSQGAQLVGFGVGGLAVAAIGAHAALAVDAGTFVLSALLIAMGIRSRRRAAPKDQAESVKASWLAGVRIAFGTRHRRLLLGLAWLVGLVVVPEGLAVPYASAIGGGAGTAGLLLAACPAGLLLGSLVYTRWMPAQIRARSVGVMAMLGCVPLMSMYCEPPLGIALGLLAFSGAATAYQTQVIPEFVTSIAVSQRGRAIATASAGLLAAQGLGLLLGGAVAQFWGVGPAIAVCGAAGTLLAWRLTIARAKDQRERRRRSGRDARVTPELAVDGVADHPVEVGDVPLGNVGASPEPVDGDRTVLAADVMITAPTAQMPGNAKGAVAPAPSR